MPGLPAVSARGAVAALSRAGFSKVRQRGSHIVLQKTVSGGTRTVVVPNHPELAKGTLRSILRKAQLSVDEFVALLQA